MTSGNFEEVVGSGGGMDGRVLHVRAFKGGGGEVHAWKVGRTGKVFWMMMMRVLIKGWGCMRADTRALVGLVMRLEGLCCAR